MKCVFLAAIFFRKYIVRWLVLIHWLVKYYALRVLFGLKVANTKLMYMNEYIICDFLRLKGASIGSGTVICEGLNLHNARNFKNLNIGDNCHIGRNCFIDLKDQVSIGDNVVISMNASILTHIDVGRGRLSRVFPASHAPVTICNNCYVGERVTLLKGVTLNENVFVGAFSLVNTDCASSHLYFGIPVKKVKYLPEIE